MLASCRHYINSGLVEYKYFENIDCRYSNWHIPQLWAYDVCLKV